MVLGAYIIVVLLSSMWLVKKTEQNLLVMLVFLIPSVHHYKLAILLYMFRLTIRTTEPSLAPSVS